MLKWLLTVFVAVVVVAAVQPRLSAWLGIGRLPGDFRLRWRGREYVLPFASTVLWSLLATALVRLL